MGRLKAPRYFIEPIGKGLEGCSVDLGLLSARRPQTGGNQRAAFKVLIAGILADIGQGDDGARRGLGSLGRWRGLIFHRFGVMGGKVESLGAGHRILRRCCGVNRGVVRRIRLGVPCGGGRCGLGLAGGDRGFGLRVMGHEIHRLGGGQGIAQVKPIADGGKIA
ncbi:MAG TPA: hypothetical protein ENK80_06310 [Rhodobacterales bacterium]|nr:hypothetical protein [Rhodobacterales bacterium]